MKTEEFKDDLMFIEPLLSSQDTFIPMPTQLRKKLYLMTYQDDNHFILVVLLNKGNQNSSDPESIEGNKYYALICDSDIDPDNVKEIRYRSPKTPKKSNTKQTKKGKSKKKKTRSWFQQAQEKHFPVGEKIRNYLRTMNADLDGFETIVGKFIQLDRILYSRPRTCFINEQNYYFSQ